MAGPGQEEAGSSCPEAACCGGRAGVVRVLLGRRGAALLRRAPAEAIACLRAACDGGHADLLEALLEAAGRAECVGLLEACGDLRSAKP